MADDNRDLQERRVTLSEVREERFQRAQAQREQPARMTAGQAGGKLIGQVVSYSGRGALEAEFIAGLAIIAIRIVAEYEKSPQGPQYKGTVIPPQGQLGPLSIFAALLGSFLFLSLIAAGGGLRAKLAVIMGGAIVLTLGMKSASAISKVAAEFGGGLTGPATVATDAAYTSTANLLEEEYGPSSAPPVQVT